MLTESQRRKAMSHNRGKDTHPEIVLRKALWHRGIRYRKNYRKLNKLSVRDVSGILKEKSLNVAEKTIYGWESGQTQPNADTLLMLCEIYNIENILGTFGYTDEEPINLTSHEVKLIKQYRNHPEIQDAVNKLLDV